MKLSGVVLVAIAAFALGGGAGFAGSEFYRTRQAAAATEAALAPQHRARAILEPIVYDPESLRLRGVTERNGGLCGELNARNRRGGYEGFRRFVVTGAPRIEIDGADPERQPAFERGWAFYCADAATGR